MWGQKKTMVSAAEFLRRIRLSLYERGLGSILRYNITAPDLFEVIQFLVIFSHYSVHAILVISSPNRLLSYSVTTTVSYLLASEDRVGRRNSCRSGVSKLLSQGNTAVNMGWLVSHV